MPLQAYFGAAAQRPETQEGPQFPLAFYLRQVDLNSSARQPNACYWFELTSLIKPNA
ncbi:Uncharacterised protein [Acinetobacter baumannii]|nr:hypothetical protein QU96_1732 [Acinetobacter baumannii]SSP60545.1 Uncharacterised protein [Acinetobacter baumannii]SSS41162.1 Uncharacterised protein [Acinetobacter baumannii]